MTHIYIHKPVVESRRYLGAPNTISNTGTFALHEKRSGAKLVENLAKHRRLSKCP